MIKYPLGSLLHENAGVPASSVDSPIGRFGYGVHRGVVAVCR